MDFDQPLGGELREKVEQVLFQPFGRHVVFCKEDVAEMLDSAGLLQQCPDPCPDGIETVVDPGAKMEDRGFAREVAGDLVLGYRDDRCKSDAAYPMGRS